MAQDVCVVVTVALCQDLSGFLTHIKDLLWIDCCRQLVLLCGILLFGGPLCGPNVAAVCPGLNIYTGLLALDSNCQ